jgi:hypothetical protein
MRKAEFTVPQEAAVAFCDEIIHRSLPNEITGTTEDNELIIEVAYEKEQNEEVDELETHLENLIEQIKEESEEEED